MRRSWLLGAGTLLLIVIALAILGITFLSKNKASLREKPLREKPQFILTSGENENLWGKPLGIATQEGKIFVADGERGGIQILDNKGHFLFFFYIPSEKGETSYPSGVAVDKKGRIYVSDLRQKRLMIFSSQGEYLSYFPSRGRKKLIKPLALGIAQGKLFLTDVGDQSVKIFSLTGKFLKKFGKAGNKEGEFLYPNGIALASEGKIFVADSNNQRVQVFDQNGRFIKAFGQKFLELPRGIALDSRERVHVADTFASKILVFSQRGEFLFSYGKPGGTATSFPQGIAIDPKTQRIYVTDRLNNYVTFWRY